MDLIKKTVLFWVVCLLFSNAYAEQAFVIQDIQVKGLQRVSLGTVLNYLPVHVGQSIEPQETTQIIKALYKTGFFDDIQVERQHNILVIEVKERATIAELRITGNELIPTKTLLEALKSIGLSEGQVYDPAVLDNIRSSLQNQYYDRGNYNATVSATVTSTSQNRVIIHITVVEGQSARIKEISIVGNQAFSDSELIKLFQSSTAGIFSYFSHDDLYSKEKLDADIERLRSFYLDQGYVNFKIESSQVTITPTREQVYVVIRVSEGAQYTLKGYRLAGKLVYPEQEIKARIFLKEGQVFSRKRIQAATNAIGDLLGDRGYAYASVQPLPEIDEKTHEVFITFFVEPGKRIYVRQINFTGNVKTEDSVIRRQMRQAEGAVSSVSKVKLSEQRLNMLPYLKDISIETKPVPGSDDEVDLNVKVAEAPAASLSAGVGYSNTDRFLINAGLNQANFLGTGNFLGFNFAYSQYTASLSGNYYNPYYTQDGLGRGIKAYASFTDYDDSDASKYQADRYGASIYYSLPITEFQNINFGYGVQFTDLTIPNRATPAQRLAAFEALQMGGLTQEEINEDLNILYQGSSLELQQFKLEHGSNFDNALFTGGWNYINLNRGVFPTRGYAQYLDAMVALPLTSSSLSYYKTTLSSHLYQPLLWGFILSLRGELGYGNGFFGDDQLPFYENYYAGGMGVQGGIRGYQGYSVGAKDSWGNTIGGNFLVDGTVGLIVPLPFAQDVLRTSWFVDAGNVYTNVDPIRDPLTPYPFDQDPGPVRVSTGIAVEWRSPMGNLIFSLATPLNKQPGDEIEAFQFTVGTGLR